jgi:hypothetical protein
MQREAAEPAVARQHVAQFGHAGQVDGVDRREVIEGGNPPQARGSIVSFFIVAPRPEMTSSA